MGGKPSRNTPADRRLKENKGPMMPKPKGMPAFGGKKAPPFTKKP